MATDMQKAPGLDWTLHSFVFEQVFSKLAKALRLMFWGGILQVVGAALAAAPFAAMLLGIAPPNAKIVLPGLLMMVIGGIALLIGEQRCLHLEAPLGLTRTLPGHGWLRAAYGCHLGGWLLRIARTWLPRGPIALVLLPLQLVGYTFLLLFLRKTADVLSRHDLKRLVDIVFLLGGAMIVSGGLMVVDRFPGVAIVENLPKAAALALIALPAAMFALTVAAYLILLGRMAAAAAAFANYLAALDECDAADSGDAASLAPSA